MDDPETDATRELQLHERPGEGWTPWAHGNSECMIEATWWEARELHFPKENVTHFYDGSELVAIQLWGYHGYRWCMKIPPADWKPRPVDPVERDRFFKDWLNRRRAEQGLPLLPYREFG